MKWRCTWCGKPHAENDPPCDNCGHNAFEEAIVREGEGSEGDPTADTGATETGTVDTGTTYVWRCQECGRDHVKYNPPCSRCGNHALEKTEQSYDDVERDLEPSSWLEVAKPYSPILLVFGLFVALFATGIVSPSIIPGVGQPSPPDAPGEGSQIAGIDLEATELEIHDRLEDVRDGDRSYDENGLAAYAEYRNRAYLAARDGGESPEAVMPSDFGADCRNDGDVNEVLVSYTVPIETFDDERELADALTESLVDDVHQMTAAGFASEGLDLRFVDGELYVFYATC
ncbi:hypothetical protein [Haloterrigena alkaliphila]|uniref:Uncharacterized protein n=1 Tax=Haloterrigena alkaliphila TaxID=2816475 RepID=A0A8A2VEH5_9EURY|nr:hypothetical protein [Haloterrigena alkaliphila]QSW98814.1 hypothetical protein J0X25_15690 [Haloterrigena alkaliphila]